MVNGRVHAWLKRYVPAECGSIVGALLAANLTWSLTSNAAAAAFAAAWGENLAYYGIMLAREVRASGTLLVAVRDLLIEFGPAEVLDTGFIRPLCMYLATQAVADLTVGVLLGKVAADVIFYVPVTAAYELRRRYLPASRATTGANASITRSNTIT
jgi:hypothetical protein